MRGIAILFAWLFSVSFCFGQTVTLPSEIKGLPGSFITIPATTEAEEVQWLVLDPGLNAFPIELLKSSKVFIATTLQEGRYRVFAYVAKGDKASPPLPNAICTITVGTPPEPKPPGPDPPKPPVPPGPNPDVELVKKFQAAYDKENDTRKKEFAQFTASLLKLVSAKGNAVDSSTTAKAIFDTLREARRKMYEDGEFELIRGVYEAHLNSTITIQANKPLADTDKETIRKEFLRVASALEGIK